MNTPKAGEVVWFDIPVKDFETAKSFYGELLGWKFSPMGDAKTTDYWMIKTGDETIGGFRRPEGTITKTDCPILYFNVPKLDPSVARAQKLGAALVGTRVDIGNDMGCFHWLRDKDGNLFAIWAQN